MPILIFPSSYLLWLIFFNKNFLFVNFVFLIPVLFAYINSGIGTNYLKLWEFKTTFKVGRLPVLHGFIFCAASSLLIFITIDNNTINFNLFKIIKTGLLGGSVIGFANWLFDLYMIKIGKAVIYNKYFYENKSASTIVTDYAPLYFGTFGFCYGLAVETGKYVIIHLNNHIFTILFFISSIILCLFIPVIAHVISSLIRHGYNGLIPYRSIKK